MRVCFRQASPRGCHGIDVYAAAMRCRLPHGWEPVASLVSLVRSFGPLKSVRGEKTAPGAATRKNRSWPDVQHCDHRVCLIRAFGRRRSMRPSPRFGRGSTRPWRTSGTGWCETCRRASPSNFIVGFLSVMSVRATAFWRSAPVRAASRWRWPRSGRAWWWPTCPRRNWKRTGGMSRKPTRSPPLKRGSWSMCETCRSSRTTSSTRSSRSAGLCWHLAVSQGSKEAVGGYVHTAGARGP